MANKQPTQRYVPGAVPTLDGIPQFLFDELYRIAAAINPFPVTLNIQQLGFIMAVTAVPLTERLFVGQAPLEEIPGGAWDSVLGQWVCPVTGTYQMSVNCTVEPFGAGNKFYEAEVAIWVDNGIDPPREVWRTYDAGPDDRILTTQISLAGPVGAGSILYAEITIFDDQFSGDVTINSYMSLVQVGESG